MSTSSRNASFRSLLLIVMALVALAMLAFAVVLLSRPGGPLAPIFNPPPADSLVIFVSAPQYASVGQNFTVLVTVANRGQEILRIDELRLSRSLVEAAEVIGLFPGLHEPQNYDEYVGYPVGLLLQGGDQLDIEVTLRPRAIADLSVEVSVSASGQISSSGLRLVFADLALLTPPTPLPTLTPMPTLTPTLIPPTFTPTATLPPPLPFQAVVQLIAQQNQNGKLRDLGGGSAVIISPDGLLVTNAHIVTPPNRFYSIAALVVALAERPEQAPVRKYYAQVLQVDTDLDIAVLRITTDLNSRAIDPIKLNLPYVPVGDSDLLKLGDPLWILGFPLIGGDTVTLSTGEVAGFTPESKYGERSWIKTTGMIAAGTSGGMVIDANGFLVAIPTRIGYGKRTDAVDCRVMVDTNLDGNIDSQDTCIPVGGFINALRPINLAKTMIEAARLALGTALPKATSFSGTEPALMPSLTPIP